MRCPICHREVAPATTGEQGTFFPFCSARCRDVDLGRWLDGKYQIPAELADADDAVNPPPTEPND